MAHSSLFVRRPGCWHAADISNVCQSIDDPTIDGVTEQGCLPGVQASWLPPLRACRPRDLQTHMCVTCCNSAAGLRCRSTSGAMAAGTLLGRECASTPRRSRQGRTSRPSAGPSPCATTAAAASPSSRTRKIPTWSSSPARSARCACWACCESQSCSGDWVALCGTQG
jgi:hypothetical protein